MYLYSEMSLAAIYVCSSGIAKDYSLLLGLYIRLSFKEQDTYLYIHMYLLILLPLHISFYINIYARDREETVHRLLSIAITTSTLFAEACRRFQLNNYKACARELLEKRVWIASDRRRREIRIE